MDGLHEDLVAAVGSAYVVTDPDVRASYERDWTGRFAASAAAVVRPGTADEVASVLRACSARGVPVTPQGGNTGLVGGGIPAPGGVILSLLRMADVGAADPGTAQLDAGAGASLAAVQARAEGAGMAFGLDFAARDTATVGGAIATDAGGIRAVRHGTMRAQVAGLEAVLADGTIVRRLSGLPKDNAGLHLPSLIVGSEGTLAVVTRARLRLVPRPPRRVCALVGLESVEDAVRLLEVLRAHAPSLDAVELMFRDGIELVLGHRRAGWPVAPAPVVVLVECASAGEPLEELAAALDAAPFALDTAVADDSAGREALWALREAHTEAVNADGVPHKLDVAVPLRAVAAFCAEVTERVGALRPGARVVLWSHLGDGNVHVNLLGLDPDDEAPDVAVLELAAGHGGTISAEHGVGRAKAAHLGLVRSPGDIAAMRSIKAALDPAWILNPGAVLA